MLHLRKLATLVVLLVATQTVAAQSSQPATLPAVQSFKQTSIYVVNGAPDPQSTREEYYDRTHGMLLREIYSHGTYITHASIGKTIKYREGRKQAIVSRGYDLDQQRIDMQFAHLGLQKEQSPTRDPDQDIVFNGEHLLAYRCNIDSGEFSEWTDDRGFVRRWETEQPASYTSPARVLRTDVEINPTLPESFWQDPKDLQIVDSADEVTKRYPLDKSLFTKDVGESTFGIHYLSRDAYGDFFVIASIRLQPDALQRARAAHSRNRYSFQIMSEDHASGKATMDWRFVPFARIENDLITVQYMWIVPRSTDLASDETDLAINVSEWPDVPPGTQITTQPKPTIIPFKLKAGAQQSSSEFAGRVFDEIDPIEGILDYMSLDLGITRTTRPPNFSKVADFTRAQFIKQLDRYLRVHQQMQARMPPNK